MNESKIAVQRFWWSRFGIGCLIFLLALSTARAGTASLNALYPSVAYGANLKETAIAVYDMNGDGRKDVVTVEQCCDPGAVPTALIFLQGPDGLLEAPEVKPLASLPLPNANPWLSTDLIAVADFNGDGYPDLAIDGGGVLHIVPGTAGGNFAAPITVNPTPSVSSYELYGDIRAIDWYGTGRMDLATVSVTYTQTATGTTKVKHMKVLQLNSDDSITVLQAATLQLTSGGGVIADLEGTGAHDYVSCCKANGSISIQKDNGTGYDAPVTYGPTVSDTQLTGAGDSQIAVGDLNGDNRPDIVVSGLMDSKGYGSLEVYTQNSDGSFTLTAEPSTYYAAAPSAFYNPYGVVIADLLGTGLPGIIASDSGWGTMSFIPQTDPGYYFSDIPYPVPVVYGLGATSYKAGSLAVADISSDGKPDVILADALEGLIVWYNTAGTVPELDAGIQVATNPSLPIIGQNVTFLATVSNTGPSVLKPSTVSFNIPYLFQIDSVDPDCTYAPPKSPPADFKQLMTCTTGSIAAGGKQVFTFKTTAIADPYPDTEELPDYKRVSFAKLTEAQVDVNPINNDFMLKVVAGASSATTISLVKYPIKSSTSSNSQATRAVIANALFGSTGTVRQVNSTQAITGHTADEDGLSLVLLFIILALQIRKGRKLVER